MQSYVLKFSDNLEVVRIVSHAVSEFSTCDLHIWLIYCAMAVSKALFHNETLTAELCVWSSIESLWFRGQEHAGHMLLLQGIHQVCARVFFYWFETICMADLLQDKINFFWDCELD